MLDASVADCFTKCCSKETTGDVLDLEVYPASEAYPRRLPTRYRTL